MRESITKNESRTSGEYYTGNPGRQPDWTTYGEFRWKLTLESLSEVLEYISGHPKATDSMAKSSFIFQFLLNNVNKLTGTVYVGGSTPNLNNAVSEIVTRVRKDGPKHLYYGSSWSGKWLYTESLDLVSQSEITKRDLNPQLDCKFVSIRRLMVVYFFSGTGSFAPFDMVTVNRSILLTHSGLMRKPA